MEYSMRKGNKFVTVETLADKEHYLAHGYELVKLNENGTYETLEESTKMKTQKEYNDLIAAKDAEIKELEAALANKDAEVEAEPEAVKSKAKK